MYWLSPSCYRYEIVTGQSKFFEWQLDTERNLREFKKVLNSKPTFFNINDKMGFDGKSSDRIRIAQEQLKEVMEEWLPDPSEFERVDEFWVERKTSEAVRVILRRNTAEKA